MSSVRNTFKGFCEMRVWGEREEHSMRNPECVPQSGIPKFPMALISLGMINREDHAGSLGEEAVT